MLSSRCISGMLRLFVSLWKTPQRNVTPSIKRKRKCFSCISYFAVDTNKERKMSSISKTKEEKCYNSTFNLVDREDELDSK